MVRSFNWRDIGGAAVRQLNNQNYNICFRTEAIDKQVKTNSKNKINFVFNP
jgi:hypothetical protein